MMKVVWLCHFINSEIKKHLNTPNLTEMAPWIDNLIQLFREKKNIELHIVSPNLFTNDNIYFFKGGVFFHFYQFYPKLMPRKLFRFINKIYPIKHEIISKKINTIVKEIQPDLIHLHGAENPYYSCGIIQFIGKYPILMTIQGFARNSTIKTKAMQRIVKLEEYLIKNIKNIGTRTKEMERIVLSLNPKAKLHFHNYPITIPTIMKDNHSEFDIVYFARITKDKGIEDLLKALGIIKKAGKDISLHIIGSGSKVYKWRLLKIIKDLNINSNIVWVGFIENQNDLFKYAVKAKLSVLPTLHDVIPGTIIESMLMKLPVIAYAVGGIPELNNSGETISLVEKNNIEKLADKILFLLNNPELRKKLAENAFSYANKLINNERVAEDIIKAYKIITDEFVINCKLLNPKINLKQ